MITVSYRWLRCDSNKTQSKDKKEDNNREVRLEIDILADINAAAHFECGGDV